MILITALPDGQLEAEAISVGAQCLLRKPLETQTLLDCLARSLSSERRPDKASGTSTIALLSGVSNVVRTPVSLLVHWQGDYHPFVHAVGTLPHAMDGGD